MDKEYFIDLYAFRTRHLHELTTCFDKMSKGFEKVILGETLADSEKITLKEYGILREIAALAPFVNECDGKMLEQLPADKIHKCKEIVDYFEQKKEVPPFHPAFFVEPSKRSQAYLSDYYTALNAFISMSISTDLNERPSPPSPRV